MSKFLIIFAITLAAATVIQAYPQAQEAIRQPKLFLRIKGNPFNEEYYNAGINKNHFFSEYQDFPLDFCGGYNYIEEFVNGGEFSEKIRICQHESNSPNCKKETLRSSPKANFAWIQKEKGSGVCTCPNIAANIGPDLYTYLHWKPN